MVEWLAGNRLRGTTAERPSASLQSPSVGGWVEVGRTTLSSAGDTIDVTSLPDKRYYMVLHNSISTGNVTSSVRLNGDSDDNYAWRYNDNGTVPDPTPITSNNAMNAGDRNPPTGGDAWAVSYLANKSGKEKLMYSYGLQRNTAGANTVPTRGETASKWTGTGAIYQITSVNQESGDWASGSEMVVLGWDPADTHTTNFWQELASVDLSSGASDLLSSGTISAKKYLWVQFYVKKSGSIVPEVSFNDSTGNEYAYRFSDNGASDGTPQVNKSAFRTSTDNTNSFVNMFIINNSGKEKLVIVHSSDVTTTGAGTEPSRREIVAKWTGSSQITKIDIDNVDSGNFDTASTMKVWGSD